MVRINVGNQTQTTYFIESGTYGAVSGNAQWLGYVDDHTVDEVEGRTKLRYVGTGSRTVGAFVSGATSFKFSIPYIPQNFHMAATAMGKSVTSAGSTHTYSESGTLPSYQIEDVTQSTTGSHQNVTYIGAVTDKFTVEGTEQQPIKVTLEGVAQTGSFTRAVATTPAAVIGSVPFMWSMSRFNISGAAANGKLSEVTGFTWNVMNNLNTPYYLNSTRNIGQPVPTNQDYELELKMNMSWGTGTDLYDKFFRGGSAVNFDLFLERVSGGDWIQIIGSNAQTADMDVPKNKEGPINMRWLLWPQNCTLVEHNSSTSTPFDATA